MTTRRSFLIGCGLGLGATMLAGARQVRSVFAAGSTDELRFVHVYLNGGWDVLLGADTRAPGTYAGLDLGTSRLAAEWREPLSVSIGGATTLVGPTMANLVRHADRLTLFRGVNMNTVAHATGRAYVNSFQAPAGTVVRGSSMATAVAAIGPLAAERILPNVAVGFPSYNTRFSRELTAVSLRRASEIGGLLRPLSSGLGDDVEARLAAAQDATRSCVSDHYIGPRPAEQLTASRSRMRRLFAEDVSSHFDFASASAEMTDLRRRYGLRPDILTADPGNPSLAAALASQLVRVGLSRSVTVALTPSLDTHGAEWATAQPTRQKAALDAVAVLLDELRADDPDLARTVVLVTSEFARTPRINGTGGRDHWFANSMLVFSSALRSTVFGATVVDNLGLQKIDLDTGAPSESGAVLLPEHVGATLLSALGGDASPLRIPPISSLIARPS